MDSTERTLLAILKNMDMTLSTAESCTGGLIAKRITDVPGSSAVFDRGFITYSNQAKIDIGVPAGCVWCWSVKTAKRRAR